MPWDFRQGGSLGSEKAFEQRNKGVGVPAHLHSGGKGKATLMGGWQWTPALEPVLC